MITPPTHTKKTVCINPTPHMLDCEIELFNKYLKEGKHLLEFGSGVSTRYVLNTFDKLSVMSIDTDNGIIANLKKFPEVEDNIKSGRLKLYHLNIGPVKEWGQPLNPYNLNIMKSLFLDLWSEIDPVYDLCMIDGRYRVFNSLLGLCKLNDAIFLFHDFVDRSFYHVILKYIDVFAISGQLLVYKRKDKLDYQSLIDDILISLYDFR